MLRAVTLLAASLAALVSAEGLVRVLLPESLPTPSHLRPDPDLGYVLKANLDVSIENTPPQSSFRIRTNSRGLRMAEEVDDSAARQRVLVLGDSFTFGFFVSAEESYFHILKQYVERHLPAVQLLNCGVGGYSTGHAYKQMKRFDEQLNPAAVIYFLWNNDLFDNLYTARNYQVTQYEMREDGAVSLTDVEVYSPLKRFLVLRTPYQLLSRHSQLFALVRIRAKKLLGQPEGPVGSSHWDLNRVDLTKAVTNAHLERMAAYCDSRTLPLLVVWIPSRAELFESSEHEMKQDRELFEAYRAELAGSGAFEPRMVDFYDPTAELARAFRAHGGAAEMFDDTGHFTLSANALFAKVVQERVTSFLAEWLDDAIHRQGAYDGASTVR